MSSGHCAISSPARGARMETATSMSDRRNLAGSQPSLQYSPYRSTEHRAPSRPMMRIPGTLSDLCAPVYGWWPIGEADCDLTRQHDDEPHGQRIVVDGRIVDEDGRPVAGALVEVWQANAAGRYRHANDAHPAPLDPN